MLYFQLEGAGKEGFVIVTCICGHFLVEEVVVVRCFQQEDQPRQIRDLDTGIGENWVEENRVEEEELLKLEKIWRS